MGKIRYIGASNWDSWHVVKAGETARRIGAEPITSNQLWYSLADRGIERSIVPACRDQGVGVIAWGAVAHGFLSGRYRRGAERPEPGARNERAVAIESNSWQRLATSQNWDVIDALERVAQDRGAAM